MSLFSPMIAYRWKSHRGPGQRTLSWLSIPVLLLCSACGSLTSIESDSTGCPESGCFADASVDTKAPPPDAIAPQPDGGPTPNLLCGTGCDPDQSEACSGHDAQADGGVLVDAGPPPMDGGPHKDGGEDAQAEADAPGGNMGGSFGPSVPSGEDGGAQGPDFACQVTWAGETTQAVCTPSGSGKTKDPCSRSSDCAAGLTCVGTLSIAQCLKYCCLGNDACPSGFYCSEEVARDYLADHPSSDPAALRKLPVCVPARGCDPLDPQADPKKCDPGLSCAIVRSDGTTGCIPLPKDAAKEGGSCKDVPCAQGLVCAKSTNTCKKLCHVGATDECDGGVCQAGSTNLPEGFGICVGNYDK